MTKALDRVAMWERRTEWPLAAAALAFLVCYAVPILDTSLKPAVKQGLVVVDYVLWAVFIADFLVRLTVAQARGRYLYRHVPELLTLALPVLRPLRLLRLVVLLRVLNRRAEDSLRGRVIAYTTAGTALIVFCAALAVLDAERGHRGANISSFGDALWRSATTITTVGYGDRYPVTTEGRFVAVGLMLSGIALLGVVTASFASWLVDRVRAVDAEEAALDLDEIRALRREIADLRHRLDQGISDVEPTV